MSQKDNIELYDPADQHRWIARPSSHFDDNGKQSDLGKQVQKFLEEYIQLGKSKDEFRLSFNGVKIKRVNRHEKKQTKRKIETLHYKPSDRNDNKDGIYYYLESDDLLALEHANNAFSSLIENITQFLINNPPQKTVKWPEIISQYDESRAGITDPIATQRRQYDERRGELKRQRELSQSVFKSLKTDAAITYLGILRELDRPLNEKEKSANQTEYSTLLESKLGKTLYKKLKNHRIWPFIVNPDKIDSHEKLITLLKSKIVQNSSLGDNRSVLEVFIEKNIPIPATTPMDIKTEFDSSRLEELATLLQAQINGGDIGNIPQYDENGNQLPFEPTGDLKQGQRIKKAVTEAKRNKNWPAITKTLLKFEPRSQLQASAHEVLNNDRYQLIGLIGPAGASKTFLAAEYALQQIKAGKHEKVTIVRPMTTTTGVNLGAMPGNLSDKTDPYFQALNHNIDVLTQGQASRSDLIDMGLWHEESAEVILGRTISGIIIIDEAQNFSAKVLRQLINRAQQSKGKVKIILAGDLSLDQMDLDSIDSKSMPGLLWALSAYGPEVLENTKTGKNMAFIGLEHSERSEFVNDLMKVNRGRGVEIEENFAEAVLSHSDIERRKAVKDYIEKCNEILPSLTEIASKDSHQKVKSKWMRTLKSKGLWNDGSETAPEATPP